LASIEEQLQQLEEVLLNPATRTSSSALEALLAEDFCEFGSSGSIFNKQQVVEALQGESPGEYSIADFHVRLVAHDVALAIYKATLRLGAESTTRTSLRSSLWVMRDGRWKMLFHQGTRIPSDQRCEDENANFCPLKGESPVSDAFAASELSRLMLDFSAKLQASVRVVDASCSSDQSMAYKRIVTGIYIDVFVSILEPLYKTHPSLKPADWD